jgi:hypothetical protein
MRVWRSKAREAKKAKPLAFETLKTLRVPARSAGEAEAMRPALKPKMQGGEHHHALEADAGGARRSEEDSAEGDAEGEF